MNTTPVSLLERLRAPGPRDDWDRFVFLYTPLLCCWARRLGLHGSDVEDVVQDVLTVVVEKIGSFDYDPQRRFRGWLWTVLANKIRAARRRVGVVVTDGDAASRVVQEDSFVDDMEDAEYRQYLVQRILPLLQPEFQPQTWQIFEACALKGQSPAGIAARFNMSLPAVYAAKSRVLRRVRAELADLID